MFYKLPVSFFFATRMEVQHQLLHPREGRPKKTRGFIINDVKCLIQATPKQEAILKKHQFYCLDINILKPLLPSIHLFIEI